MSYPTRLTIIVLLALLPVSCGSNRSAETGADASASPAVAVNPFEGEIQAFEAEDNTALPPEGAVLFVGSSSIRLWTSLADDMAPVPIIRRGFGGASLGDCIHYVDRIVTKYNPAAIFVFCGSNDIAGETPKSAKAVRDLYVEFVGRVRERLPEVPIYFISISPTKSRWQHVGIVNEANRLVEEYTETSELLHYVDTASSLLDDNGEPRDELFREDRLHLTAQGYAVWTSVLRPIVEEAYASQAAEPAQ